MLVTIDKLNVEFIDDLDELERLIDEYSKLELAIEESVHYKLLAGKTQTLGKNKGVVKERSRFVHTNNIANMVARKLVQKIYSRIIEEYPDMVGSEELRAKFELNRELAMKKAVCMAKAHDIGHVAFGHEGERAINNYFAGLEPQEVREILKEHRKYFGDDYENDQGHISQDYAKNIRYGRVVSFEHNELSAILFNQIVKRNGINLPQKELEDMTLGILAHSTSRVRKFGLIKHNLPAQIIRAGDKVEYRNADYDEIRQLIEMDPDMPIEVVDYLQQPLVKRINTTNEELVEEAIRNGRIWESRLKSWESEPVMQRLSIFRKAYEDAIFLYDSSYSYHLLKDELFPLLDKPEELKKYYEEHPGVDVFYPEDVVREIYEKAQDLDTRAATEEAPSLEADELDEEIWKATIPFKSVMQGENSERIYSIYLKVLDYYHSHPELIPNETEVTISPIDNRPGEVVNYQCNQDYRTDIQKALEYVSLLDDESMIKKYKELVELRIKEGPGHGVEPVTAEDMKSAIYSSYSDSITKFQQGISIYSKEEAEKIYIQTGKTFYEKGLTPLGKDIYKKYYAKRFAEYAEDQELYRRMEAEDRRLGRVPEEDEFEEVTKIEAAPTLEEPTLKSQIPVDKDSKKEVAAVVIKSTVPSKYKGPYTAKKGQREERSEQVIKIRKTSALARIVGRVGLALQGLSQNIEEEEARKRDSMRYKKVDSTSEHDKKARTAPNSEDDSGHNEH